MNEEQNQVLEWNKSMSVGNELLDNQHKQLLKQIGVLKFALLSGDAVERLREIGEFLENYIKQHLSEEEKYMLEYNYPGYENHKKIHDWARQKFAELLARFFNENEDKMQLAKDVERYLHDWWINHITVEDKKYADYINKLKVGQKNTNNTENE